MNHLLSPEGTGVEDAGGRIDRILIVDDEARLRSSMGRLLARSDRQIFEAGSVAAGMLLLESQAIDVALLDIGLPDASGLDLLHWISRHRPETSVIMVSGDIQIESAIRALRDGAVEFVRKGTDIDFLTTKVTDALTRRRLQHEHRRMTERLAQSERLHRFLVENSPDVIYALDSSGRFTFVNARAESLLGCTRAELQGRAFSSIVAEADRPLADQIATASRDVAGGTNTVELRLLCRAGEPGAAPNQSTVMMVSAIGIYDETTNGATESERAFLGSYGVARDITERKRIEEIISFHAFHDQLTGLPNRRLFKDHLELALTQAARREERVGVMFVDLDRFKLVNDTYGHLEGDELLRNCAQRIRDCVRAGDTVARQGGDEFTVLLPGLKQPEDAMLIADKISAELRLPFQVGGREFFTTASIGIAVYPEDGDAAEQLLHNADTAMYEVKAKGKNAARIFSVEMNTGLMLRLELERDLRRALPNDEFVLHFQPQFSLRLGRVIGAEALIRWRHPQHGLMNPGSFMELAEETGLMGAISAWVLEEACRQLSLWHAAGNNALRVAVNLSPHEFSRPDLVERVAAIVARHGLPRDVLEIEITENVLLQDVPGVIDKLRQLRERGIRIAIDDFGTRYSSLNYLRSFPINTIKIDQSFIRDIEDDASDSPIITAIVGIARGFNLDLVAEGVENDIQRRVLARLGCDEMQGFLFARPTMASDMDAARRWQQSPSAA
ncbi:MAG: EAL domain-containing protein [Pseudomonadota bacterium]|nr:EAL domain-containing protein [Pseudomonadota bacterium]